MGVPKHLEKDALGEGVELGKGGAALGAKCLGLIQDRRDAALLEKGWEGDLKAFNIAFPDTRNRCSLSKVADGVLPQSNEMEQKCLQEELRLWSQGH